jgi:group I intron endonuclease
MFHIIYKTTNIINGKIYIGAHSTINIDDGYLGSGKYLVRAIEKYGRENFSREVLFIFDTKEEMFQKEREIVCEEFIEENNTYNLKIGGSGGNPGIVGAFAGKRHSEETKCILRERRSHQKPHSNAARAKMSKNNGMRRPEVREKLAESLRGYRQTDEHKQKVALANIDKVKVNNGIIAKSVTKEEAEIMVSSGEWVYGLLPRNRAVV